MDWIRTHIDAGRSSSAEMIVRFTRNRRRYTDDYEASSVVLDWAFGSLGHQEVISYIARDDAMYERTARQLGGVDRSPARSPTDRKSVV